MILRLIKNAHISGTDSTWVLFDSETILDMGSGITPQADIIVNAHGALLLPGGIDAHVHFRDPGLTHKADIVSESRAAIAGGITTVFDMPNTVPQTVTRSDLANKMQIASKSAVINMAFFIGATNTNIDEVIAADYTAIPGIKVFMGSSTGNMLVDSESTLDRLFALAKAPIVVHAEDETVIATNRAKIRAKYGEHPPISLHTSIRPSLACVNATKRAIELASRHPNVHLHIAHLTTADEVKIIADAKDGGLNVTAEVSPTHLLFTENDYAKLGSRIKINPSVKTEKDREALRKGVMDGIIDIIATDHAPHLMSEKQGDAFSAVSGAPMVQFSLPLMLDMFGSEIVRKTMMENPAKIFGLSRYGKISPGFYPDLVLIETCQPYSVSDNDVISKCGWTPLINTQLKHRVVQTFVNPRKPVFNHS